MTVDYSQLVPAADRALRLLEALAGSPDGLAAADLAGALGIRRSAVYALINTLKARDYIVQDDNRGRYRIGPAVAGLAAAAPATPARLVEAFHRDFEDRDGGAETYALVWPDTDGAVVTAQSQGRGTVRVVYEPGMRRPGDGPDALVLRAGAAPTDTGLRRVRHEGIAVTRGEDVVELAVPVCADGIHPTAALLAGLPVPRAGSDAVDNLATGLRQAAARLSHRIGATVYQPYGWAPARSLGPSRPLDPAELDEFLRGMWGAQLACVREDGSPHIVPLWYEWDGASVWLAASPGASWRDYVADGNQVSLTLDEPWPPLRRAFIDGVAHAVADSEVPGGIGGLRSRLAVRYLGRGAEGLPELSDTEGWTAVRVTPRKLYGKQGLGGPGRAGAA